MVFLRRRRLVFWLARAYIKKWGKTILFCFVLGLVGFFLIRFAFSYLSNRLPFVNKETIGLVGTYTSDSLPDDVVANIGRGLTKIGDDGLPKADLASGWEIRDNGKTYVFRLKKGLHFTDGTEFDSSTVHYNFLDVKEDRPNKNTIIFTLKDNYAPFLVSVSKPVFKDNYIGVGNFKIRSINLNSDFIQSIDLVSAKNDYQILSYEIYPTEEALENAYVLGEVKIAKGLSSLNYGKISLKDFKNTKVDKQVDKYQLVSLFYNTQDPVLSEKRLRQALTYAIPDNFSQGVTNRTPFSNPIWTLNGGYNNYSLDYTHSKLLMSESSATDGAKIKLTITTLSKYEQIAKIIKKSWDNIGIDTTIKVSDTLPDKFQIFLGSFAVSKDPDQYTLWHSGQDNNITGYKNLRIDKLLEDGRKTVNFVDRQKIYTDFEKYLLDDAPASFLYLPYVYTVTRI